MNSINISTNGDEIKINYSSLRIHDELESEMGNLFLQVGDIQVQISFDSCQEMIDFCNKHNFEYEDNRPPRYKRTKFNHKRNAS